MRCTDRRLQAVLHVLTAARQLSVVQEQSFHLSSDKVVFRQRVVLRFEQQCHQGLFVFPKLAVPLAFAAVLASRPFGS
jgi:hypothetical protein